MKQVIYALFPVCSLLFSAASLADATQTLIQRGEYLAIAGDCSACHHNPENGKPFSGGFGIQSPMGMIYGSNITPSKTAGIGQYSLADFTRVMREGKAPGNHYLYPAMPYTAFAGMSDDDIRALYTYLMNGVAADDHPATKTDLPFPFSFRPVMALWNLMFLDQSAVKGSDAAAGSVDRGEYLVRTLAHCSTCHTPRNGMMAEQGEHFLAGGKVGRWTAPNITPDAEAGIGSWSEAEIVTYLRTGVLHGKAVAGGEMGTAIEKSFSRLQSSDLYAMARYLKQLPATGGINRQPLKPPAATPVSAIETGMRDSIEDYVSSQQMSGAQLYNGACASCHASDGRGTRDDQHAYPSLVGLSSVAADDPANLIMIIAEGINRDMPAGHAFMPAFEHQFTQQELAKVANYVSVTFGNPQHVITLQQVDETLHGESGSWIVRHAAGLAWSGVAGIVLVMLWALLPLRRRRA